jgi:hypothetical protein
VNPVNLLVPRDLERPSRPDPVDRPSAADRADTTSRTSARDTTVRAGRAERPARSERPDAARRPSRREEPDAARRPEAPDFPALLALMAADRQAPTDAEPATLDRLLDGTVDDAVDGAIAKDASGDDASSAMRYGMLQASTDAPAASPNGAAVERRSAGSQALEALARVASRRSARLDDLLAVGDARAADARATLDALLARAGTPEGLAIADAARMTDDGILASAIVTATLAAARAKSAGDVNTPVRDPGALLPEFRTKLDRVIARMKSEYGHDVTLVETTRSAERQRHLYAQGRTRPGPVVTWTQDSAHQLGAAADVVIDGTWDNAGGYARLQRIAREEGLRTLGMRDPGHLELPLDAASKDALARGLSADAMATAKARAAAASTAPRGGEAAAQAAGIARVASVAGVARVAGVASVIESTAPRTAPSTDGLSATAGPATAAANGRQGGASGAGTESGANGQQRGREDLSQVGTRDAARSREEMSESGIPAFGARQLSSVMPTHGVDAPAPAAGADAVQRVADLQALRDSAPAGSLSQLTMEIDGPDGSAERVTIGLRGTAVGAHITTDAASAERMRLRTGELQEALGRHGLEADSVRISATARGQEVESARGLGTERDGLRLQGAGPSTSGDAATGQGQRERSQAAREWDKQEDARRARDEQPADRDGRRSPNREDAR